jgi:hypothetical protein
MEPLTRSQLETLKIDHQQRVRQAMTGQSLSTLYNEGVRSYKNSEPMFRYTIDLQCNDIHTTICEQLHALFPDFSVSVSSISDEKTLYTFIIEW